MKKLECIIRPTHIEPVIIACERMNIGGMSITQIVGYGEQRGSTNVYRGVEYEVSLKEKVKVEIVVDDDEVEPLIDSIINASRTDAVGDGKIFILPVEDAVRIRTGERHAV